MKTHKIIFIFSLSLFCIFPVRATSNNMPSIIQTDTVYYIPGKLKHTARLFSDLDNLSSVVLYIPADSTVQIISPANNYFLVHFQGIEGYILQKKVENYTGILRELQQPVSNKEVEQNQIEEKNYDYLVSKYGKNTGEKIYEHKIWKGMTTKMVQDSWGRPRTINHYRNYNGVKEEWIYPEYILVFWDNRLTSWYKRK